mmetsp:Transcript_9432/g.18337  ORF Transcript_9432/g.18337 Transcript_9432/m.18337 type:complete len:369 (-) Transcript_9432:284-1390(-)|eukprot:CAMPEP_0170179632 /NCGR_PEP_ID=MMETSP0040_2-20121228/18604_1 /TAXON_ID=641309 /ORGANISM="Lotharella oceanica, Strain CCMP622" /LENGTH=368 /DNA_ID=CAMNT_0010423851 /DNA_START=75 /DNA_END=1181 /DNA_ORIENTATION=+
MASHAIHSVFKGVAEYFTPVLQSSNFKEKGVLTPEEFVKAGDQLVFNCRTWKWAPGKEGLVKPYLPKDKQFLITRNVPSLKRATDYALSDAKETVVEDGNGDEGWVSTHNDQESKRKAQGKEKEEEYETIEIKDEVKATPSPAQPAPASNGTGPAPGGEAEEDEDEIPDMDDFEEDNIETDPNILLTNHIKEGETGSEGKTPGPASGGILRVTEPEDNIERTRTYDISITYDKYYRTPRIFLFGYDKTRQPLSTKQIMEDISADHAHKTVTVDPHPHLEVPHASIHPCKHAPVMLRICERMEEENIRKLIEKKTMELKKAGKKDIKPKDLEPTKEEAAKAAIKVEQYLFLFLKFISSVIPTIEYDYTF